MDAEEQVEAVLKAIDDAELALTQLDAGVYLAANGWRFIVRLLDGGFHRIVNVETAAGDLEGTSVLANYYPRTMAPWSLPEDEDEDEEAHDAADDAPPSQPRATFGQAGDFGFLRRAFEPEGVVRFAAGAAPFRRVKAARLRFDSSRWQLSDVDELTRLHGFDLEIPRGEHSLFLTLARPSTVESVGYDFGHEVVAYATLEFSPEPPDRFFGYARFTTETATAAFMSEADWFRWYDAKQKTRALWDELTSQLEYPSVFVDSHVAGHHVVMFKTGVGDGNYAVYTAVRGDRLVGIVADFRTLPNQE